MFPNGCLWGCNQFCKALSAQRQPSCLVCLINIYDIHVWYRIPPNGCIWGIEAISSAMSSCLSWGTKGSQYAKNCVLDFEGIYWNFVSVICIEKRRMVIGCMICNVISHSISMVVLGMLTWMLLRQITMFMLIIHQNCIKLYLDYIAR